MGGVGSGVGCGVVWVLAGYLMWWVSQRELVHSQRNLLRIAIHSLGTPLWGRDYSAAMPKFFHQLRSLLRQSYTAALVTVPVHLFEVRWEGWGQRKG